MTYPKRYEIGDAPSSGRMLMQEVLPRLLEGEHPALAVLRNQLRDATVTEVELSGAGFLAHFAVPANLPATTPPQIVGGDAEIALSGVNHGAGCVLFVKNGRLSLFEGYTYGEEWSPEAEVVSIGSVTPLEPANPPLQTDGRVGRSAPSRPRR